MYEPLKKHIESDFSYIFAQNLVPLGAYNLDRLLELNKVAGGTSAEIENALSTFVDSIEVSPAEKEKVDDDAIYL